MILLELGLYFAVLSLLSFGGMSSVLPEMQRYMVDVKGWMSATEFMQLFARFRDSPWRRMIRSALGPLVVGLVLSGGYVIATPGSPDWRLWLIAGATAAGMLATRLNPLWLMAAGGLAGGLFL